MKKIYYLLASIIMFSSCQESDEVQTVTVDNKYSLTIPAFLTEVFSLNEDASLQYQHAVKEFYVICIDESKSEMSSALVENGLTGYYADDFYGYTTLLLDVLKESIEINEITELQDTVINGLTAQTMQITGITGGVDIYFSFAFVEGKEDYYQIMTWTLAERKTRFDERMNELLYSFREF